MKRPRVSILLPVRDEEPHLAEALESLSAQTLRDHEVIVVDDGSVDGSAAVAETHARRDRRVRVLRQSPLGVVAALERARTEAKAPLLARMDGDDLAVPERLELQAAAIENEGLAACGGGIEFFPRASDGLRAYEAWLNGLVTPDAAARDVFVECPLPHPALMVRVQYLRKTLLSGGRSAVVLGAGPTGKSLARELLRAGTPLAAFVEVDPRKLGKRIHGAPVVPIEEATRFPGALALGAVSAADGRALVREQAAALGLQEGSDFVAVA